MGLTKFEETVKDALKAMHDAEVGVAYYIQDPKKKHSSAVDSKLYTDKNTALKVAKKLSLEVSMWPGIFGHGEGKYDMPKKYTLVEEKTIDEAMDDKLTADYVITANQGRIGQPMLNNRTKKEMKDTIVLDIGESFGVFAMRDPAGGVKIEEYEKFRGRVAPYLSKSQVKILKNWL